MEVQPASVRGLLRLLLCAYYLPRWSASRTPREHANGALDGHDAALDLGALGPDPVDASKVGLGDARSPPAFSPLLQEED